MDFMKDRRTFVRRVVLAEVLGPPRGRTLRAGRRAPLASQQPTPAQPPAPLAKGK